VFVLAHTKTPPLQHKENTMKRIALLLAASALLMTAACKDEQAPPPKAPSPPAPVKPVVPSPSVDASPADARLGMMERHAIWKAKKESDEKLAAEMAAQEKARLVKFDKSKLSKHAALFAFETKTRQALDQAAEKLNGKLDAADQLKKLAVAQRKAIETQANGLRAMDPKGGNSNIATDHDVVLNLLANDYPEAIVAFFEGQTKPLAEVRAEMDKREKKISSWLAEVKSSK
jgi:hypothetical protein